MNAYELADSIITCTTDPLHKQCADMLRQLQKEKEQQADRIAELEKEKEHLKGKVALLGMKDGFQKMQEQTSAEPVAWVIGTCYDDYRNPTRCLEQAEEELEHYKKFGDDNDRIVPLYTTPQTKPLSDSELNSIWFSFQGDIKEFARAIEERILGK